MLKKVKLFRSCSVIIAFAGFYLAQGCVSSRPSRTGVFNENQYVRKSFLVRDAELDAQGNPKSDKGWFVKTSVTQVSSPNPLGSRVFRIFAGAQGYGDNLVRFAVTQDKLQMISMREMSAKTPNLRTPSVQNAWPITNVDLQYRVNLDGEKTNFYEENQERDWRERQFIKVNFAKNDLSDLGSLSTLTNDLIARCTAPGQVSTTLVPGSFFVDEKNNYMEWLSSITLTLKFDDTACLEAYGSLGDTASKTVGYLGAGRRNVTLTVKYSLTRADSEEEARAAYKPMVLDEKDPIRHKYLPFEHISSNRDEIAKTLNDGSGMLASTSYVMRFNPEKSIILYFDKDFPVEYKKFFTDPGGIADKTNALFQKANVPTRVEFREANDPRDLPEGLPENRKVREDGDVRYSFVRWISDKDSSNAFIGIAQFFTDPRTGETRSASITLNDFEIKDRVVQRIDAYLKGIGLSEGINSDAEWPDLGQCNEGDIKPILQKAREKYNSSSSLFGKMQQYMQMPESKYGPLGPKDFIVKQDPKSDFYRAYYRLAAYNIFADPNANFYVIPEGGQGVYGADKVWQHLQQEAEFHRLASVIDRGQVPFSDVNGAKGFVNALGFANQFKKLTQNHLDFSIAQKYLPGSLAMDGPDSFSLEAAMSKAARRCIAPSGQTAHYQTKSEWTQSLIETGWKWTVLHEFGHILGLRHNFMGSVDKPNFPEAKADNNGEYRYSLHSSSVMEYSIGADTTSSDLDWGPYDKAAIAWIYSNNAKNGSSKNNVLSGQESKDKPWKDPLGFVTVGDKEVEREFLRCSDENLALTPLCRQGDFGSTPSEIMASQIEMYEWQYPWRNSRTYRKFWNNSHYADGPANLITDMRRFLSLWAFDWQSAELTGTLHRIGIDPPAGVAAQYYYEQLTRAFTSEMSATNSMVAAFSKAILQQSTGERPYATSYDKFYGDTLVQGIILDKYFAMQSFLALWPTVNYDQNQAGAYISTFGLFNEPFYRSVAEDAAASMIGSQYAVYPYFIPTAVAVFAQDTHSISFSGHYQVRNWTGGWKFDERRKFVDFFKQIAVRFTACGAFETCSYDPTSKASTNANEWNEFEGPDSIDYIWAYIPDRGEYVLARKDINIATYKAVYEYNDLVLKNLEDDESVYPKQLAIKYTLDAFTYFN